MERIGRYTLSFSAPRVIAAAASVGKTEGEGPLAKEFDVCNPDDGIGCATWEHAEAALAGQAAAKALEKAGLRPEQIDIAFAGDLLNQCTASTFGLMPFGFPYAGLFGACSTFALALLTAAVFTEAGAARWALAEASSHFCSAEKQFRYPLEYGGQRTPTAQRTVTGAGAAVVGTKGSVRIEMGCVGRIAELGVKDMSNMGAAMAPAAANTVAAFLEDTDTEPSEYDMILTGDLGSVGSELFSELMREEHGYDVSGVHADCGNMIFDAKKQDVHAGASGCGCSAAVVCSKIINELSAGKLGKVLFAGTGALMSPVTAYQGDVIPAVAHAVLLRS